jgi:hypothetical protein
MTSPSRSTHPSLCRLFILRLGHLAPPAPTADELVPLPLEVERLELELLHLGIPLLQLGGQDRLVALEVYNLVLRGEDLARGQTGGICVSGEVNGRGGGIRAQMAGGW